MKRYILPTFILLIVFMSASCKSTPESEPGPEIKSNIVNQLNKVNMSKIEESRKQAQDFEAPSYFPSEWEDVEAQYNDAKNNASFTEDEVNSIAAKYDELFNKSIPLYAQAREDEIIAARDELISTGFTRLIPEYLQDADDTALEALAHYESGDYYKARDTAVEALEKYETLLIGANVYRTRREIIDRGFIAYDPDNFEKADEFAQTALDNYEAGNKKDAVANAEEAQLRYRIVLSNGWTGYASDRRASTISEREKALANKVNIAVRDGFRDADNLYYQAEENFKSENFESAATLFIDSETLFIITGQETEEKRQRAKETIRVAEEKIEESVETAIEAERIIEGGSK